MLSLVKNSFGIICTAFVLFFIFLGCTNRSPIKVAIQPYGFINPSLVDTIASAIRQVYGANVSILENTKVPSQAFVHTKAPRYRADSLIRFLKKSKADSFNYIMGITNFDISCTKLDQDGTIKKPESTYSDWGIFGLAYIPSSSSIISSFRLHHEDQKILMERLKKVAIHELGHNLGLPHCATKYCVMQDAVERIQTIDEANAALCTSCKAKIR